MAQENVEVARQPISLKARPRRGLVERIGLRFRPLVELSFDPVYRGREARAEFQRRWTAEWGEMRFMPEEMLDLGDHVVCVGRVSGSGLSSRAAFEGDWACLFTISAGRVIREQPFFDRREALEAVGLS